MCRQRFLWCKRSPAVFLAALPLLLTQSAHVRADLVASIEKTFTPIPTQTDYTLVGVFSFPPLVGDILGEVKFTKDIIVPLGSTEPMLLKHFLIGDWKDSWSLTKIGFQQGPGGTLIGFPPTTGFGATGTFDVAIEMLGPVPPGHPSLSDFVVDVPIAVIPIDDVFTLPLPASPDVTALLSSIVPGSGFVPVAFTSLHIPEPSAFALGSLGLLGIGCSWRRKRA